jgi:hypothetical protein
VQFTFDKNLRGILSEIEEFLVSNTPRAIAKLKLSEPVYAVFLWYHDSSVAGDFAPNFGVGVESMRLACAKRYEDPASVNDCIWRPQQVITELVPRGRFEDRQFVSKCNEAYALMLAANTSDLPLEDEGDLFRPFRSMMHRTATRLNEYDWTAVLHPMEEFVVVSLHGIGYWLAEDLRSSIPKTTFKLLQRRGLLAESK